MRNIPIGLQLYTVRDECAKDFVGTLKKVAKMGYKGVELHDTYSLSGVKLSRVLDDLGLKCIGNHMPRERDLKKLIYLNSELGCSYVWGPCLPEDKLPKDEAGCIAMARYANKVGAELKKSGIHLYYHNHAQEFEKIKDKYILDWLYENTDPELVMTEIDVMWVQYAGIDPASYIHKYPGRCPLVHIKDMDANGSFTEVGEGILDFNSIFSACDEVRTKWYIVEQDICKRPSIESAYMSFEYFKSQDMV